MEMHDLLLYWGHRGNNSTKTMIIFLTGVASEGADSVVEAEGVVLENLSRFVFYFSNVSQG